MAVTVDDICRLIAIQLGLRSVDSQARIIEDLGAESIDVVNIIATIEERYHIEIAEEEIPDLVTVADLHRVVVERSGR